MGSVSWVGGQVGGWYGHCVPAGVMNNGKMNCGDNSDEGTEEPVTCQWPLIRKADGMCKECKDGWTGSQCEINSNVDTTLSPTETPTTQPIECEDKPSDKFFYKTTKGKNKKPIYKKCKWLAKKSQQKIGQICG